MKRFLLSCLILLVLSDCNPKKGTNEAAFNPDTLQKNVKEWYIDEATALRMINSFYKEIDEKFLWTTINMQEDIALKAIKTEFPATANNYQFMVARYSSADEARYRGNRVPGGDDRYKVDGYATLILKVQPNESGSRPHYFDFAVVCPPPEDCH
ncbi:MAG: hypothetical protein JWP69_2373 [Flaviaesturariibacter sp.]|nr:hypothetical protein [Flaviaesturariibacter sp.]